MSKEDIAIVGMSIYCPAGECVEEFWHGIAQGADFITEAPADVIDPIYFDMIGKDADRFYCNRGGFAKQFKVDPLRYGILPIAADGIDPDQLASMAGVEQALIDAGVFEKGISLRRGSVIIGKGNFSGYVALRCMEVIRVASQITDMLHVALPELTESDLDKVKKAYQARQGRFQADIAIGTMPNLVASLVANRFDLQGPAYTVDAACASGIIAINQSIGLLRSGEVDVAVAGGMHTGQSAMFWSVFDMMGALSRRQQIAPFSADADGLLVGQGVGFIVLKTLKKAREDDDRIYAVIKDTAICSDGGGSHVMVTSVEGQTRVLKDAWGRAGMDPAKLGYIEAHGTGTPVGDRNEIETLKAFFGDKTQPRAYVGSLKSNMGHAMPAAGMLGVIKTALALYHRKIPPTLHCETPLPAMFESRFMPPQELIDWDGERLPLVAGVNAFGFGGINAHAVLAAYDPESVTALMPKPAPWLGETLRISAADRDALLKKLEAGDYTDTGGVYRLIIFDPDEKRLRMAVSIVEKDEPWRGRLDIWFTNRPMLSNGGKIVFLIPGFNLDQLPETDSISDRFGLPRLDDLLAREADETYASRIGVKVFHTEWITKSALEHLGVYADMYAGQSVGEWTAMVLANMLEGDKDRFFELMDADDTYPMVAVSGADCETAETWCAQIPGLYLVSDNCPSQILLSGEQDAVDTLKALLEEEQIFYTVMPFGAGYHTPLLADSLKLSQEYLESIRVHDSDVQVWSATTLAPVPTNKEQYVELVEGQLTRPVYFRSLIEKLYEEQDVRVFIQLGVGTLVGFVDDTLKGRDYGAVSGNVLSRDGSDQLRRVLALLFVEGRDVDAAFLGVKPTYRVDRSLMLLPKGAPPHVTELPELNEAIARRYGAGGIGFSAEGTETNPLLRAANDNMRDALRTQNELIQMFGSVPVSRPAGVPAQMPRRADAQAKEETPLNFEEELVLAFEDHPYLIDHAIVRQPEGWAYPEDLNPVVPLAMTIELLAEAALNHAPGRKLLSIRNILALRWINVETPFHGTLKGVWKDRDHLTVEVVGHVKAEIVLGDDWPEPPEMPEDLYDCGEEIVRGATSEELYRRYSFHGPNYHSNVGIEWIRERGFLAYAEKKPGRGSLLDIMGQQLGLYLHLTQAHNVISFPVRLKELSFFADIFDQKGRFTQLMRVTRLSDISVTADMYLSRDGKLWCKAEEYVCQRFEGDPDAWDVISRPRTHKVVEEIAPGVYCCHLPKRQTSTLSLLARRYLNHMDVAEYEQAKTSKIRWRYLYSRIALKDAARIHVRQEDEDYAYPVEIFCAHDENGRPFVYGKGWIEARLKELFVSLSHKDDIALAMASNTPVGVDIEKIEERDEGFMNAAFTEQERAMLESFGTAEWATRFWVAKEACAKKAGTGLKGNPKRFEVGAVEGDVLFVNGEKVQTAQVEEGYVAGWTI
jgi:acyl transferase domain-containing protein/phosphopantetheinyl transferase